MMIKLLSYSTILEGSYAHHYTTNAYSTILKVSFLRSENPIFANHFTCGTYSGPGVQESSINYVEWVIPTP